MYRKEHKGINEVYQEVASLFDDNPILPHEFPRFLPEASASASAYRTSLRNSYQCYDERSSGIFPLRLGQMDKELFKSHGQSIKKLKKFASRFKVRKILQGAEVLAGTWVPDEVSMMMKIYKK
ncbi:SIN3-like 4 [Artemisia annua]|uniref:SIN3-like 4 n=1 Tax=Artemisia annua TaxID=35608 RepID=A0A2U1PXJ0_ARTAN|nr:SIN3-like 4 [Artemisia annua]